MLSIYILGGVLKERTRVEPFLEAYASSRKEWKTIKLIYN
jgi:hypothetical protein